MLCHQAQQNPKNYVSKTDIESRLDKIDATLERIFDKLEAKADK